MYTRANGRFPRGMRIPENYSGNAFRVDPPETSTAPPVAESTPLTAMPPVTEPLHEPQEGVGGEQEPAPQATRDEATPTGNFSLPGFRFSPGKLFSRFTGGGFGFEELLLIGLIFLLAEEGKNDDLILLLILLLFIQ